MSREPNLAIIDELKNAALLAARSGHDLEAAVILFQVVEGLLRLAVRALGRGKGVTAPVLKRCAVEEQNFQRLVLYLDLICPDNGLSARLTDLNTRRNKILHALFSQFQSIEQVHDELVSFSLEAVRLNQAIRDLLGVGAKD